MVKYLKIILFFFMLVSCTSQKIKKNNSKIKPYNLNGYYLNDVKKNVSKFIFKNNVVKNNKLHEVLFVNSKNCISCVKSMFYGLSNYLNQTKKPTVVLVNDSTFIKNNGISNNNVQMLFFQDSTLKANNIFHNNIYLYSIKNKTVTNAILINGETIDSLNLNK